MEKEILHFDGSSSNRPLSKVVKAGDFLFLSGQPPIDPETGKFCDGNIEEQTRVTLDLIKNTLAAAGSSLDKVVKTTVFCTNVAHYHRVNAVYATYVPTDPPARTFVTVGSWPESFDIEIECVAIA